MLAKKDRRIVGIDLGTTNSVIAVLNEGRPTVLTTKSGSKMVPSTVHIGEKEVIVGDEARPYLRSDPKNTIFASKRLIGRKYADPAIQEYLSKLPYETVASCNGDIWIKTDFGKFSPAQIGAKILSKMKKIGEEYFGEAIKRAVITVPAYFDDCQKQATRDAGRIAGLDVIRIINEPTAAALAYGLDKKEKGHVAVYDLGGGTFDISILELSDGVFHVKATNGHTFLGGEDFDNAIAEFIAGQFEQEEGVKIKTSEGLQKIKRAAEEAKKKLTNQDETRVYIENVENGYDLDIKLSREQVEAVVKKIVQKTIELCRKAIADAKITTDEIKSVVLVGGMTRMPLVRKVVKEIFKQDPITSVNPDEAVGMGAAVQGGILGGTVGNVLLLDVAPLSLGIEVAGGVFSRIVDRNTTLPFRRTETFTTSMDNQEYVDIRVYQGERQLVKDNRYLGSIRLVNLPRAPRGVPKIDVTFEADVNGITKVTAQDSLTKKKQEIQITPSGGLSEEEIQRMIEDAEKNAEEDAKNLELAEFKTKALQLIEDYEGRNVPTDLKKKVDKLKSLLHSDIEKAKILLENLKKRL